MCVSVMVIKVVRIQTGKNNNDYEGKRQNDYGLQETNSFFLKI